MNSSSTALTFVRYVESRRIHVPKVLSEQAFQLQYQPISLGRLQTRWKHQIEDDEFWRKNALVGRRPRCSRWFCDFDHTMVAQVQVTGNPADVFSNDGDDSSKRLLITFNEAAIREVDNHLYHDIKAYKANGTSSDARWELRQLIMSIGYGSPFANIVSVFQPNHHSEGDYFEEEANELILLIDELWPVFFSILVDLSSYARRKEKDGSCRQAAEGEVWSDLYYPFNIPPSLQRMGRHEFDPSWEYSAHLFVFLSDTHDHMTSWRKSLGVKLENLEDKGKESVWVGWTTTVWELPEPIEDEQLINRALKVGLHSDTFKLISYFNKLVSVILEAIHVKSADFTSEELRRVVYQYHALKHSFSEKKRWLDEFEVRYFNTLNDLSKLNDYLTSDQYLGDLVIKAAEGLETKVDRTYERKIQFIAIFFTALTLAALGMDGYNFVQGSANEPVTSAVERWLFITRLGLVLGLVIALLIFAVGGGQVIGLPARLWRHCRNTCQRLMRKWSSDS